MFKKIYDFAMSWARHKHNTKLLALFGFSGAIFFPIPLDIFLIAMAAVKPKKSLYYASVAAISSICGAIVAYFLGMYFWLELQTVLGSQEFYKTLSVAREAFSRNTFVAMLVSGFTFLPFKVFTLSAGISEAPFFSFFSGCVVGRFLRFFVLGIPLYFYGEQATKIFVKHINKFSIIIILLLITYYGYSYFF